MDQFAVILPAAGKSARFGDPKQKKIYAELAGRAVWLRAVEPFVNREDVAQIILAIAAEDRELFERRYRASVAFMNIKVIEGGATRSDTVARALEFVDPKCGFVAVHDAARPCLNPELVELVFAAARQHGGRASGRAGRRDNQASRRRPAGERDRSPRRPLPGADTAGLPARRAREGLRAALAQERASPTIVSSSKRSASARRSSPARFSTSRSPPRPI